MRPALLLKMLKETQFKPLKTNKCVTNVFHPNVCSHTLTGVLINNVSLQETCR